MGKGFLQDSRHTLCCGGDAKKRKGGLTEAVAEGE